MFYGSFRFYFFTERSLFPHCLPHSSLFSFLFSISSRKETSPIRQVSITGYPLRSSSRKLKFSLQTTKFNPTTMTRRCHQRELGVQQQQHYRHYGRSRQQNFRLSVAQQQQQHHRLLLNRQAVHHHLQLQR
jgi:hypothetical protein